MNHFSSASVTMFSKHLPNSQLLWTLPPYEWRIGKREEKLADSHLESARMGKGNMPHESMNDLKISYLELCHSGVKFSQRVRQDKDSPCLITQLCSKVPIKDWNINSFPTSTSKLEKGTPLLKGLSGCLPEKKNSLETLDSFPWRCILLKPNPVLVGTSLRT